MRGIYKDYPSVRALDNVTLDMKEGEIFGFFGPNGAGKTTCIRVLTGLAPPTAGDANVCGFDIRAYPKDVRQVVSVLFDIPIFYESMTFDGYLRFFGRMSGLTGMELDQRVRSVMMLLEQEQHALRRIGKLSMGERQRAEIGRVLMSNSLLFFLDEPFSNVDVVMRIKLRTYLRSWLSGGRSVFFTSHNLLEAEHIVDRFAFIANGRITAIGTAKDLKETFLAPVYQVEVSDVKKAQDALANKMPYHGLSVVGANIVQVALMKRTDAPMIAKLLVEAGVDILEMKTMGTIEDVFQRVTGPQPPPLGGQAR